jgi:hypothetical protein
MSLVTVIESVWYRAEQGEWMMESKRNSAEELYSIKRVK